MKKIIYSIITGILIITIFTFNISALQPPDTFYYSKTEDLINAIKTKFSKEPYILERGLWTEEVLSNNLEILNQNDLYIPTWCNTEFELNKCIIYPYIRNNNSDYYNYNMLCVNYSINDLNCTYIETIYLNEDFLNTKSIFELIGRLGRQPSVDVYETEISLQDRIVNVLTYEGYNKYVYFIYDNILTYIEFTPETDIIAWLSDFSFEIIDISPTVPNIKIDDYKYTISDLIRLAKYINGRISYEDAIAPTIEKYNNLIAVTPLADTDNDMQTQINPPSFDLNKDGIVNSDDLLFMIKILTGEIQ